LDENLGLIDREKTTKTLKNLICTKYITLKKGLLDQTYLYQIVL